MTDNVLVRVENVKKKFCRSLRQSLWYGLQDMSNEVLGKSKHDQLRRDEFWAVNDVSFELRRGECLGLIGRNGAGKTTLLKMLNGLIKPDHGRIEMRGNVGALIALGAGFNPILTGRENIYVNGSVLGLSKKEIDAKFDEILDFADIPEFIDSPVQSYSSGMQVRLGFAVACALNPDVLLVDEVLAVGDVAFRMKCYKRILDAMQQGVTIILVTHNMIDVERVCQRAILLEHGAIKHAGSVFDAVQKYETSSLFPDGSQEAGISSLDSIKLSASIKDVDGREVTSLIGSQPLVIDVTVESKIEITDPVLFVRFDNHKGEAVAGMSTAYQSFEWEIREPTTNISLHVPSLPFLAGCYSVFVGLYGSEPGQFYGQNSRSAQFWITAPVPNRFGHGLVGLCQFPHEWQI